MNNHYIWSAVRQWGQRLGTAMTFVILARILSADQIGLFSAALAIMALAEVFNETGAAEAVIRHREASPGAILALSLINLGLSMVLAAGFLFGAPWIEVYFGTTGLAPVVRVLSIVLLLNAFVYVPMGLMKRDMAFRQLAGIGLSATVIGSIIGIGGAFLGWGLWALVGQAIGFATVNFALLNLRRRDRFAARPDFISAAPLVGFGAFVLAGNLLNYIATRSTELALPYHYGTAVLANYIVGSRFYYVAAQMVTGVLLDVTMARLSKQQDDTKKFAESLLDTIEIGSIIGAAIFFGLAAIAPEFCLLIFDHLGRSAWPFLFIVGVAGNLVMLNYIMQIALKALGFSRMSAFAVGAQAAASAIVLFPPWPINAIERVALVNGIVILPVTIQLAALRRAGVIALLPLARRFIPSSVAGLAMIAAIAVLREELTGSLPTVVGLAILIPAGALIFLVITLGSARSELRREIQSRLLQGMQR
ncbi:oligosaccharide flippase family protein [Sphingomonas sp. 35-24ZXX]|uniref:oligosaccharide flippase family protein n=1 Tax=Sphingomonas sp. 35-24ZXX TaxID=1545915 RepID=UPI00053BF04A|nr:oligosaccharide flippase family protein [Sphingomonas sp. 35-24ZXX]